MSSLTDEEVDQLRLDLQEAVVKCSERCLYQSAKWLAELANGLRSKPKVDDEAEDSQMSDPDGIPVHEDLPTSQQLHVLYAPNKDAYEARLEAREITKYLLAKSFFDCKEFDRCSAVFIQEKFPPPIVPVSANSNRKGKGKAPANLSPSSLGISSELNPMPKLSQKSLFLTLYSKFLAGEKRRDEASEIVLGPADGPPTLNKELGGLAQKLSTWCCELAEREDGTAGSSQGWLEFLYGAILVREKNDEEARKWLLRSIGLCPFNWGAWQELASLVGSVEDLQQILPYLPDHLMTFIFRLFVSQELYQSTEKIHEELSGIEKLFPESLFFKTQRALLYHHSKEFDEAENLFADLLFADPYRLDGLDHYSNILYVMNLRPRLSFLAQSATKVDKFRPETCCVIGNYYSLKSDHEKAIAYFRRALNLDRSFLSAWTLMGHEYVEMKNTHAAIESYRRAIDINRKDYRAWYGLGQTYEVLEMHYYALFYFQRAASLKPYDPKMWQAVGSCFNKMDRPAEAVKALKRALLAGTYYDMHGNGTGTYIGNIPEGGMMNGVMDPEVLFQIALMYEKMSEWEEAAAFMELTLAQEDGRDGGVRMNAFAGDDGDDDDDEDGGGRARIAGGAGGAGVGVGVTPTTSKARMWLAKYEFMKGGLQRSLELANELCHDGVEVEEAKALVRDLRARMERGE
ncbi:MAG: Anaphase-promoting complex subunit 23 [Watsoniomyces obsoletus]|nr:MAG: Anaphase-promoting complex subunit 23 [Watsoniomyces obsoletus]